ncbi:MAG TPA: RluA family pseudouridine synthase [Lactobacillus sp.]|nr:RluA family pseudouridine synthase [Lactobacillus sp.]
MNGNPVSPDHAVVAGDIVTLALPDEVSDPDVATSFEPIHVIMADENWLVVNKDAGINTVPGPSDRETTLVNRVKGWLVTQHADNLVPHLITRLDRDTSGLVLVARNGIVQGMVAPQVDQHLMTKKYLALVAGRFADLKGVVDKPIGRVENSVARQVMAQGQHAVTQYQVLEQFDQAALVELTLLTGRTHQIRVHMQSIGHPLIGDALYNGPTTAFERQALHAFSLEFTDPLSGLRRTFNAPLPTDMQQLLNKLRAGKQMN